MKEFKKPDLSIIRLENDDLVTASPPCPPFSCDGLVCNECADCGGQEYFQCIKAFLCGDYVKQQ